MLSALSAEYIHVVKFWLFSFFSVAFYLFRFYWVELLNHVLEKDLSTVEKLRKLNKSGKSIYNSLLVFSNLSLRLVCMLNLFVSFIETCFIVELFSCIVV